MAGKENPKAGGRCAPRPDVPPDARDPANWSPEKLRALQEILDRSRERSGKAIRDTFDRPERRMDAAEFVRFWNGTRMKAMATVGAKGVPHVAPVHAEFVDGRLESSIYEEAVRRRDIARNPNVAFVTWGAGGAAAIVYGRAKERPGSLRETRPGATGSPRRALTLEIEVTRIYAMKGREET
ncbi:MAG: hypothetical protein KatS3mg076_2174 [Candidatus Binatia bacterium]|nr:MAG: hypothetical protein KatS3mg076_2174 [Candidatus Binatia bacterium]